MDIITFSDMSVSFKGAAQNLISMFSLEKLVIYGLFTLLLKGGIAIWKVKSLMKNQILKRYSSWNVLALN